VGGLRRSPLSAGRAAWDAPPPPDTHTHTHTHTHTLTHTHTHPQEKKNLNTSPASPKNTNENSSSTSFFFSFLPLIVSYNLKPEHFRFFFAGFIHPSEALWNLFEFTSPLTSLLLLSPSLSLTHPHTAKQVYTRLQIHVRQKDFARRNNIFLFHT
jgi:hypothetical protein